MKQSSYSQQTQFWLALLAVADHVERRSRMWNGYLAWKLPRDFQHEIRNIGNPPFNQFSRRESLQLSDEEKTELDGLAERHGGHPLLSDTSIGSPVRYMDFANCEFGEEASFCGLILINASFKNARFRSLADFRNAAFAGTSDFNDASFCNRCRFDHAAFENTVWFKKARFHEASVFDGASFSSAAYFDEARFLPSTGARNHGFGGAGFRNSTFAGVSVFEGVLWEVPANFDGASFKEDVSYRSSSFEARATFQRTEFSRAASFASADFRRQANFNDACFRSTTHFRRASFSEPPMFFETKLHENTDFSDIDWRNSESCYRQPWWPAVLLPWRRKSESVAERVVSAMQAWDRLALIMSKLERFPERHDFYRLRMRAQRMRDGFGMLSLANWSFELLCDYGWSVGRAFTWWTIHFVSVGLLFFILANPREQDWCQTLTDSLLVSFANAHAFLGLTSEGGYLHEERQRLTGLLVDSGALHSAGVTQAIAGPVLLFLLLLTLRNRFRL